jgi:hypothetical protein
MSYLFDHAVVSARLETGTSTPFVSRMSDYHFTILDISFLEHLMLVNHVVLPIISVLVILPDCFYNAFFAASPISSSYSFQDTVEGDAIAFASTSNQQTVFTPPFFYSYQCASKVLISFVPLYIMKFCYVGFLRPLKHLLAKLGYDYCYTKYGERSNLWKAFRYFLPTTLQNLRSDVSSRSVYQRLSVTIQLSSYFAIIVVFGTLFPPLAVLGSVSVLSMIFVESCYLDEYYMKVLELAMTGINNDWRMTATIFEKQYWFLHNSSCSFPVASLPFCYWIHGEIKMVGNRPCRSLVVFWSLVCCSDCIKCPQSCSSILTLWIRFINDIETVTSLKIKWK